MFNFKFKPIPQLWSTKDLPISPLCDFPRGNKRSVDLLRNFLIFRVEFLINNLERYSGARPFSKLHMVVAVSISLVTGESKKARRLSGYCPPPPPPPEYTRIDILQCLIE